MPITLTTISNDLLSSTLYDLMDGELRDGLYKKNAFLDNARKLGGVDTGDGGTKLVMPIIVDDHTVATEHVGGWEAPNMVFNDVMKPAEYDWVGYSAQIGINKMEQVKNTSEKARIKIVETRARQVMSMLTRQINQQILAGAVTGTTMANMNTLNGHTITTGFLENGAPAAATQTNTVGGLAKATVNVPGWYNQYETCASSFSTAGLAQMQALINDCNETAPMGEVMLTIMSRAGFANYRRALSANERYVDAKTLDGGRMALTFNGQLVEQDTSMPVNGGVGTDEYSAYMLNFDALTLVTLEDFTVTPFETLEGGTIQNSTLWFIGQLGVNHIGSNGVLVDGDTWV